MGLVSDLTGHRVYLDTNIFIYALKCNVFLTNDHRLKVVSGLQVLLLSDVVAR